ncbi:MAG: MarR family transcriptional regulator [Flavobacteriaceae bacterium]|nr:MarR family transcriptional regulator [Flavobacteriaceae bacterium]MBJ34207.1 MarR family transcriptional regulator [Flavobacteriaceae bacterium]|tara:strand:+ start:893 stop:1309 length:417 start_codon:yes stop_codon:yes gene_type:complete
MLNRDVVVQVMKGGNVFAEHIGNTLHPFGLSLQQFNVLRILRGRNGVAASLESITEDMIHRVSNTSRIVDKLLEKAFVKRAVCLENRRKVNIFITQKGLRLLKKIDKIINQTEETLTASLSKKEMDQLLQLLNKLKTK